MTKLDLMQKIYELSGVKPDCHYDQTEDNVYIGDHDVVVEIEEFPQLKPYYPLEQVLKELPHTIDYDGMPFDRRIYDNIIGYFFGADEWAVDFYEYINDDYHQAALRLWLKVLEENIKK